MPTYEYECGSCGHRYERVQAMSAAPDRRCPRCGKGVRRLLGTGGGVIFKGAGWASNAKRDHDARFSVAATTPNAQVGVGLDKGVVRRGERVGTGRRSGRGPGNARYVSGI